MFDQNGVAHHGIALIGADGVKSAVRQQYVGDPAVTLGEALRVNGNDFARAFEL